MRKELTFRCPKPDCQKIYKKKLELKGLPKLYVQCPHCGTAGIVELDPYRVTDIRILKGAGTVITSWDFPDVIPVEQEKEL